MKKWARRWLPHPMALWHIVTNPPFETEDEDGTVVDRWRESRWT